MPEYLAPGVYVEEIEIGAKPIEGVSTSTAGFLGEAERGPIAPRLITGLEQYRRLYGGSSWRSDGTISASTLPYAIEGFFVNGGKRCFIARVVGGDATSARSDVAGATMKPTADELKQLKNVRDAADTAFKQAEDEKKEADNLADQNPDKSQKVAQAKSKLSQAESDLKSAQNVLTQAENASKAPPKHGKPVAASSPDWPFVITALGPGSWGNRITIEIAVAALSDRDAERFKLMVRLLKEQDGSGESLLREDYDDLSPFPESPQFYERRINNISSLITIEQTRAGRPENGAVPLAGGNDGNPPILGDYTGRSDPGQRTALEAFRVIDEIAIVCAPDQERVVGLKDALVSHCETMKDRFAILEPPSGLVPAQDLAPKNSQGNTIDSQYAAFYAPQVTIVDRATGKTMNVPPGGHIAGIYARTDIERGVHKAPANAVVRGAVGVQAKFTTGDQDILNPRGVNCIRSFSTRGIRVWGARTTSSDPLWKYVNVRRLFLYLEESIEESTQWVVFEPNDSRLWARVRQSVTDFLTTEWRNGALMGLTADEAFFVKCDETTMTQNDIDNGRLIVVIGVAPVKPAEFVIFRVAQWTQGSEAAA